MFFRLVSYITGAVLIFRERYIGKDKQIRYFIYLIILFVIRIFFMVFSLNLVSLILGWDGLGLVSYVLVIYYQNEKSRAAGMVTALRNRVGDAALMLCIALIIEYGSWDIMSKVDVGRTISYLLILAAITKSAQLPFSAWLPAAMAAPTPVRTLVHSSTLVTAGVYLLIRFYSSIKIESRYFILLIAGILTTFMARLNALFEVDLKKIVALSTLRQLGVIVTILSIGYPMLAYFHMIIHAFFKALLFLCRGKIMHVFLREQDLRFMGGIIYRLPLTRFFLNLANFALCGFPFLAGFYSKDFIVEIALSRDIYFIIYIFFFFIIGFTIRYSLRISFFSLINHCNCKSLIFCEEEDWSMFQSKILMVFVSLIGGAQVSWVISRVPLSISLPWLYKYFVLLGILRGLVFGWWLLMWDIRKNNIYIRVYFVEMIVVNLWFLSYLRGSKNFYYGYKLYGVLKNYDEGWIEILGGQGYYYMLISNIYMELNVYRISLKKILLVLLLSMFFYKIL